MTTVSKHCRAESRLIGLEVADAQVVEGPIQRGSVLVGVDELGPLVGGQIVNAAVLQGHGRVILPRGRLGLLLTAGLRERAGSDDRHQDDTPSAVDHHSHRTCLLAGSSWHGKGGPAPVIIPQNEASIQGIPRIGGQFWIDV